MSLLIGQWCGEGRKCSRYHCSRVLSLPRDFPIRYIHIDHNVPCLPPKVCITIVPSFSWVLQSSQEKQKTKVILLGGGGGWGAGGSKQGAL